MPGTFPHSCQPVDLARQVAFTLSPLHVLQSLCLRDRSKDMVILSPRADVYGHLFRKLPGVSFLSMERRKEFTEALRKDSRPVDVFHATPWNRSALLLESIGEKRGGTLTLLEDGAASYWLETRKIFPGWHYLWRRMSLLLLDRTRYTESMADHARRHQKARVVSLRPSLVCVPRPVPLPREPLAEIMDAVSDSYVFPDELTGLPVFFDTNDAESGWIDFDRKVSILRRILPDDGPMLYFPHPWQSRMLTEHFPFMIDMKDKTSSFNELACWFLRPSSFWSTFSSAVMTLRDFFGMTFENHILASEFFQAGECPSYRLSPEVFRALSA